MEFKEYYDYYIACGFVPFKCKGYHPSVPISNQDKRQNAKQPVSKNWTSSSLVALTLQECEDWRKDGGWLGWRVPKDVVALDVDKDETKNVCIERYLNENKIKYAVHNTKNGKHYFFKMPIQIVSDSGTFCRLGTHITYRPGGKTQLILAPDEHPDRYWDAFIPFSDIDIVPEMLKPLEVTSKTGVLDAIVEQVKFYYSIGLLNGYDHIDLPFGGFLVDVVGAKEDQYCEIMKKIFGKEYNAATTAVTFRRVSELDKQHQGVGTFVKKLQELGLVDLEKLMRHVSVSNSDESNIINFFNKEYAVVDLGGSIRIMKDSDPTTRVFYKLEDFKHKYKYLTVNKKVGPKVVKKEQTVIWFESAHARRYHKLVFLPGTNISSSDVYNTWDGFPIEARKGSCKLYLNHVKDNICQGNLEHYEYILDWMADLVQYPARRTGIAVVVRGKQGTGKSLFGKVLLKLFGQYGLHLTKSDTITSNFNSSLESKVLVLADEAFWAGDKDITGTLKAMITEDSIRIERKGMDAQMQPNYLHLIITSNNQYVVPAEIGERRFFVLECGNGSMQNHMYFLTLMEELDNGGYEALLHFLQNRDISQKNIKKMPDSAALLQQQSRSFSDTEEFIRDMLYSANFLDMERLLKLNLSTEAWPEYIVVSDMYTIFKTWCASFSKRYVDKLFAFDKNVKNILGIEYRPKRINKEVKNVWILPDAKTLRETFAKHCMNPRIFVDAPEIIVSDSPCKL